MESLLKILSEYGLPGFLLVVIITIVFKTLMKDYSGQLGKIASSLSTTTATDTTTELRYHPFFSSAHYKIVAEIPTLELSPSKPVKQQMFRDLLTIYIKTMIDTCMEIIENDMSGWSGEKWANEVSRNLNRLVTDFQRTATDAGIPEAALSKFSKWHYPTLEMLYEYITMLGNSNIYSDNLSRNNTFLLMMNLMLVTTLGDAERSVKELNGEVGGKMYKNAILEH
jgi:hypothetical protein